MSENYDARFFQNRDCPYFPCHKTADPDLFNCHFCYCPLYCLDDQCGGTFRYTEKGVKDCTGCLRPHSPEHYDEILEGVSRIVKEMAGKHKPEQGKKIFISHSSADAWALEGLISLLRERNPELSVFCSSEAVILPGDNYKETIFREIREADYFAALISSNYWKSKYCIMELGAAYAGKKNMNPDAARIMPLILPPIEPNMAMANTPLVEIEVTSIINPASLAAFLKIIQADPSQELSGSVQIRVSDYSAYVHRTILSKQNVLRDSRTDVFFEELPGHPIDKKSVISRIEEDQKRFCVEYHFRDFPYSPLPSFASFAILYEDGFNLREYYRFDKNAEFCVNLLKETQSPEKICVEFKSNDRSRVRTFERELSEGTNELRFPLEEMNYEWSEKISEICFVLHPQEMKDPEGRFILENFHVHMECREMYFS